MKWVLFAMYMTTVGPVYVAEPTIEAQQHDTVGECSEQLTAESHKLVKARAERYLVCEPLKVEDISIAQEYHSRRFEQLIF